MERAAERERYGPGAVPAHFEHGCLEAGNRERGRESLRCSARVNDEIGFGPCLVRSCKAAAERGRDAFAVGIDVDQLDLGAGQPSRECGGQAADHAGADDRDPIARTRCRVPQPVDRCFHVRGKHCAPVRDILGNVGDGIARDDEAVLMGMEAEHTASESFSGTLLNHADARITVFDRSRELAFLEGAAHSLPFALRHLAAEDETFAAPAYGARKSPDQ